MVVGVIAVRHIDFRTSITNTFNVFYDNRGNFYRKREINYEKKRIKRIACGSMF